MNTIKLTGVLSLSGEPIFVNLDNVTFYHHDSSPSGDTKYTQIFFGDSHWVRVKETPEEIAKIMMNYSPTMKDLEEANIRMQDAFYKSFLEANKDGEFISTDGGCITHYHLLEREDSDGLPI